METGDLLSIGMAATEAGVGVSKMRETLRALGIVPAVRINHIAHYRVVDVDLAIERIREHNAKVPA